ncbi:hypothetical protein B0J17DRAFT_669692 [Rhizoctonia solani]|nr:hypothetical protein B0J17DRAFT_669692 [Rhizoctonia solani]
MLYPRPQFSKGLNNITYLSKVPGRPVSNGSTLPKIPTLSPNFFNRPPNSAKDNRKEDVSAQRTIKPPNDPSPNAAYIPSIISQLKSPKDIIEPYYRPIFWIQIIGDLHAPFTISLLPNHPLVVTIAELLRRGFLTRSATLLDRVYQGRRKVGQKLSVLFFSPRALELLVDTSLECKSPRLLPSITRELARTNSTQPGYDIVVYEKLMDTHYQLNDPQSVLSLYSAHRNRIPMSQFMFKRTIQSLFKQFLPPPDDQRRFSIPHTLLPSDNLSLPAHRRLNSHPPIESILEQLRRILNHMASENQVPSSRLLADMFRGLGAILKLETQGVEVGLNALEGWNTTPEALGIPAPQGSIPVFRLENLVLDETVWSTVGSIIHNTLGKTVDPNRFQRPGDEGRMMLLMAWADVMLSLREDIAGAIARTTSSRPKLKALSNRVNKLLATNQAWNYQRTFDRLALASSLRPHHVNSFGEISSELDPALDLPVGPAPGRWPISRTLNEAQRISLLVRDRLVDGDSVAALLHFHSLASLCGAFRRLCASVCPEDAPSLYTHGSGNDYERPPEDVLAEARQELEMRVEGVYVRLASHALRTGDPSYVNDVLELAYTLPPRQNKRTFSRVWKRALSAFVKWRAKWYGSGGIGRAAVLDPSRELFDLGWLRDKQSWPDLGRNVFTRRHVVSALIEKAEENTPAHLRLEAKPKTKITARHLRDAQRLSEEAKVRETIRGLREDHPRSLPRSTDQHPSSEGVRTHARKEDPNLRGGSGDHTHLVGVLGALKVPIATSEAERLGYDGPRHESNVVQNIAPSYRK